MTDDRDSPPPPPFDMRSAFLEFHAVLKNLVERVGVLERVERRLNYPALGLLSAILATLLYIAHRIP